MNYKSANEIKSCFDDVYCAPTPHAYFNEMHRLGYEIGQQAKEYFRAAALLLKDRLGSKQRVRLLDLGCSYGVGAALLKYNFSFAELAAFFARHPARDYDGCVEEMRELLATDGAEPVLECAGADASKEAIQFATEGGLIDAGIAKNLEENDRLDQNDAAILRRCNLLISTGAIGYVGEKTLKPFLQLLGKDLSLSHGPYAVVTILRMFDPRPIARTFAESGYAFTRVPEVSLRQRCFDGQQEHEQTLELLEQRGIDPEGKESEGHLYADLFAAAPEKDLAELVRCLRELDGEVNSGMGELVGR